MSHRMTKRLLYTMKNIISRKEILIMEKSIQLNEDDYLAQRSSNYGEQFHPYKEDFLAQRHYDYRERHFI